ncbi:substrate-binding domain-containing protein [Desulfovermiculus halophilus]|jgi:tungstate transport system substrate-binding protein|uniref:substrate-binding domain-containing protein n=1 Tax=Desulfovermiculus halophilus TaxID=339722 RepID=UPI0004883F73|nr:substrate-binding domain-containing protein [Desulfovermiculus halophilus]
MNRRVVFIAAVCLSLLFPAAWSWAGQSLMMATTTSTDNTGLLDQLAPMFEEDTGIELKWTAVGTGKALELGRNCDVDVLMVHAPPAEKAFIQNGYGVDRTQVMYNDFVLIGPKNDPAGIQGMQIGQALRALTRENASFASRGDDSGTNKKERGLWTSAGLEVPEEQGWYLQTGQGMLPTIRIAAERDAYTLTDRGTYIKYAHSKEGNPPLEILVEGDTSLFNQYSVIPVSPDHCPNVQYDLATRFAEWISSPPVQDAIGEFRLLGKQLFTPNADSQ